MSDVNESARRTVRTVSVTSYEATWGWASVGWRTPAARPAESISNESPQANARARDVLVLGSSAQRRERIIAVSLLPQGEGGRRPDEGFENPSSPSLRRSHGERENEMNAIHAAWSVSFIDRASHEPDESSRFAI
jgi:hypothetical protein